MAEYEKIVREILRKNGCYLKRHGKGDHDIWYSPITNLPITVDGEIKSRHVANSIMQRAGKESGARAYQLHGGLPAFHTGST